MFCGSLTFKTSTVRILCDTHVSYSLSFLPALVGTHLNLFRTNTICFVPFIQVFEQSVFSVISPRVPSNATCTLVTLYFNIIRNCMILHSIFHIFLPFSFIQIHSCCFSQILPSRFSLSSITKH